MNLYFKIIFCFLIALPNQICAKIEIKNGKKFGLGTGCAIAGLVSSFYVYKFGQKLSEYQNQADMIEKDISEHGGSIFKSYSGMDRTYISSIDWSKTCLGLKKLNKEKILQLWKSFQEIHKQKIQPTFTIFGLWGGLAVGFFLSCIFNYIEAFNNAPTYNFYL